MFYQTDARPTYEDRERAFRRCVGEMVETSAQFLTGRPGTFFYDDRGDNQISAGPYTQVDLREYEVEGRA